MSCQSQGSQTFFILTQRKLMPIAFCHQPVRVKLSIKLSPLTVTLHEQFQTIPKLFEQNMSILDEDNTTLPQLLNAKATYLCDSIAHMRDDYQLLSELVKLYQQATDSPEPAFAGIATQMVEERERLHEEAMSREEPPSDVTQDEFVDMVMSFEDKVQWLQRKIREREEQLQGIEDGDAIRIKAAEPEIKALSGCDAQTKIIARLRRETVFLKNKKKQLESQLLSIMNSTGSQPDEKGWSVGQGQRWVHGDGNCSEFQKVVLLLKKKKYQNAMLNQQIQRKKKALSHKQYTNKCLSKQVEGQEWNGIDNMTINIQNGWLHTEHGDLSMANRTFNAPSFSFDVSRFFKPKNKMTFGV